MYKYIVTQPIGVSMCNTDQLLWDPCLWFYVGRLMWRCIFPICGRRMISFQFMMVLASFSTLSLVCDSADLKRMLREETNGENSENNYLHPLLDSRNSDAHRSSLQDDSRRDSQKYQHLCDTVTNTMHLNTRHEEFNPPFYVEKRCKQDLNSNRRSPTQVRLLRASDL